MKYFIISLTAFLLMGCKQETFRNKPFDFSSNDAHINLRLSLPDNWIGYKTPKFLDDHLILNDVVGRVDSSSWVNVKIYNGDSFLTADVNSLLNWQIEQEVVGNYSVKLEKSIEKGHTGKNDVGVLRLSFPAGKENWYARKVIIKNGTKVIVISLTDKINENRLERIFQNIKSDLKIEFESKVPVAR